MAQTRHCPTSSGTQSATSDRDEAALAEQSGVLTQIARPYAAALFDLAKSEGSLDAVEAGLASIQTLADDSWRVANQGGL